MALFLAAMGGGPGRGEEPESFLAPLRLSFLLGGMPGLFLGILLGVQSARRETAPRWRYPLLGAFLLGGLFTLVTTLILLGR